MMKSKFIEIFTVIFAIVGYIGCESLPNNSQPLFCTDLKPQIDVDIDQILGMWYADEIIIHQDSVLTIREPMIMNPYDSCVSIHLSDITHNISQTRYDAKYNHYLRLVWSEQSTNVEYTIYYNETRRGFWMSPAPQKGTMLKLNQSPETIQVMKAVENHMVLTFCGISTDRQSFSVALSRKPNTLSFDDIQSVHSLLNRRGLATDGVRRVCNGSMSLHGISFMSLFITTFVAFILNKF